VRASVGIIGYGLLLSRCNDGATKTCLLGVNAVVVDVVVAVEVVVDVVVLVVLIVVVLVATDVVTSDVTKVTGRSLESIIFVEAIEELKNFEVILLTAPFILSDFFFVDNIVEVATSELSGIVGLGVIGILRTTGVDLTPDPVILLVNSVPGEAEVCLS
jgi:hypothetical protein